MREGRDIETRYVVYFAVFLMIGAVVAHLGVWWLFDFFVGREEELDRPAALVEPEHVIPPQPQLQVSSQRDNRRMLLEEAEVLNEYGWVDRDAGIARIPIERAMEIIARRNEQ